jgi:hypothetical protein
MELDIVEGLEQLKPEMNKYANFLCKALGMSVAEVDEIVQRTLVDIWQISQRDGSNPTYDKRHGAGKRIKGSKAPSVLSLKPAFEDTYEGNRAYKKWVLSRTKFMATRVSRDIKKYSKEVSLTGMENYLTNDPLPARPTAVPKYDWE